MPSVAGTEEQVALAFLVVVHPLSGSTGTLESGTAGQLGPRGLQGCGLRDPGPIASARAAAGTGSHPARPALTTASLAAAHPPGSAAIVNCG